VAGKIKRRVRWSNLFGKGVQTKEEKSVGGVSKTLEESRTSGHNAAGGGEKHFEKQQWRSVPR